MAEIKLDLKPLEVRGLFYLQTAVLQASQQADQAALMLKQQEVEAAKCLAGVVPEGVSIRMIRIDQRTSEAFYTLEGGS